MDDAIQRSLAAAYERARANVARRIAVLDHATRTLAEGTITEAIQAEGEREAHQLAGSAGTVGLPEISVLAAELEALLHDRRAGADRGARARGLVRQMSQALASRSTNPPG